MDQIQQSLCDLIRIKPECLTDRSILRAALADYIPNDRLKQNLLLNAFDAEVNKDLIKSSDTSFNALDCISRLEKDYGITKDSAYWAFQTWCYLLGLDNVGDTLTIVRPRAKEPTHEEALNTSTEQDIKHDTSYDDDSYTYICNVLEQVSSNMQSETPAKVQTKRNTDTLSSITEKHDAYLKKQQEQRERQAESDLQIASKFYDERQMWFTISAVVAVIMVVLAMVLEWGIFIWLPEGIAVYVAFRQWDLLKGAEKLLSMKRAEYQRVIQNK